MKAIIKNKQDKVELDAEYKLIGVMHSVDKWLEGDELETDEVTRAATMREKLLRIIESQQKQIEAGDILIEEAGKTVLEYQDEVDKLHKQLVKLETTLNKILTESTSNMLTLQQDAEATATDTDNAYRMYWNGKAQGVQEAMNILKIVKEHYLTKENNNA